MNQSKLFRLFGRNKAPRRPRIWELDAWRGATIIYMILFHLLYDLQNFYGSSLGPHLISGPVSPGLIVSLTFYPLAGISSCLSRNPIRNGLRCAAAAALFSLVSWYFFPDMFICFGTLHLLAVAMLLTPLWNRIPTFSLPVAAAACLVAGNWASQQLVPTPLLIPLGLTPVGFRSMDYFPLFPYLGPYLMGIWLYRRMYEPRDNRSLLPEWPWTRPLQFLGRHSLPIYILHQPLLIVLLILLFGMPAF